MVDGLVRTQDGLSELPGDTGRDSVHAEVHERTLSGPKPLLAACLEASNTKPIAAHE